MSEASFRKDIEKLKPGDHKEYTAEVRADVSASGRVEVFYVDVFCVGGKDEDRGRYKLQWSRHGTPELPELKREASLKARETFRNVAYLTSGFGYDARSSATGGMKDVDMVIKVVRELAALGVLIKI